MRLHTRARELHPAQVLWLALTTVAAIAWALVFIPHWGTLQTACHPDASCASFQLNANSARILAQHGITLTAFAVGTAAALAVIWAIWVGLASLIIWRKPDDRGAVLCAFALVLGLAFEITSFIPNQEQLGGVVSISSMFVFGLMFPDGRFVPRWTRWLAIGGVPIICATDLPQSLPFTVLASIIAVLGVPLIIIGVQVYRYRRVSSWHQRQQTKWALMGTIAGLLGFIVLALPYLLAPQITGYGTLYDGFVNVTGTAAVTTLIPIFIGIAVLKSRLWDIDRLINRALVYAILTATLGALYIGCVLGLQGTLGVAGGGSSPLVIALSTLAVAALFTPLRRRIQSGIDRRFYRSKYDAQRTLAAFGERLRDEVELTQLSEDMTQVVRETLQPAHVSLWLAGGRGEGTS